MLERNVSAVERPRCHHERLALERARSSRCPKPLWLDRVTPWLYEQPTVVYYNVGANKGFNVASMMQRMGLAAFTTHDWWSEIQTFAKANSLHTCRTRTPARPEDERHLNRCVKALSMMCGVCNACKERQLNISVPEQLRSTPRQLQVHAFELLWENVEWLRWAFARFVVRASLLHAGVSNHTGEGRAPIGKLGDEGLGIRFDEKWASSPVRVVSLDRYAHEERVSHVHLLDIDAEGHDPLILEGMSGLLESGATDLVEFEYNAAGAWTAGRSLEGTLAWLRTHSYQCWWQSANGCISPASAPCWRPSFEWRGHSNLVCAHEGDTPYYRALVSLSNECAIEGFDVGGHL